MTYTNIAEYAKYFLCSLTDSRKWISSDAKMICQVFVLRSLFSWLSGADPGFEKGGGAEGLGRDFRNIYANLGDFLKKLALKGVGVHPLRPPPSGSAPDFQMAVKLP